MNGAVELEMWLREDGQLGSGPATLSPLGGGVSGDIFTVTQEDRKFVVKRALAQLRVAALWQADVSRNAVEYAFYQTLSEHLSGCIPQVYFHNPERAYFTMECLAGDWENWKELLLRGNFEPQHGTFAGDLLGRLHHLTWKDGQMGAAFDTTGNFHQLRTSPYILSTAERRPEVRMELLAIADQLERCRLCLVHGDFSPKNILVREEGIMLLDAEVAWFGDPAFDVAFLLTHLFLKGCYFLPREVPWEATAVAFLKAYRKALGVYQSQELDSRCMKILAALLLARVDGKSPVNYLSKPKEQSVRAFALEAIRKPWSGLTEIMDAWTAHLTSLPNP